MSFLKKKDSLEPEVVAVETLDNDAAVIAHDDLSDRKSASYADAEVGPVASLEVVEAYADEHVIQDASDLITTVISLEDDPTLPVLTFRFWFLGAGLATFGAVLSEIYYWKPQGATVSALFQLIIAYVLGNAMHAFLPSKGFFRYLNPGPFNIKEHTAITVMASTASSTAEAISAIAVLNLYYNYKMNSGVAIVITWASQLLGYGFSGVLQSMLVYPTYALYPVNIPTITLLQNMHFSGMLNHKRMRYFWIVFTCIFFWEIIPQWMFPLITAFSIICLADRGRTDWVRNIFGAANSNEGIGLFSFGIDWVLITQAYPLYWPLQTQVNSWLGMLICYTLCAAVFYSNAWGSGVGSGLPFMSTSLFTANGSSYDQSLILNTDGSLNRTALDDYGLPHLTSTYALALTTHNISCGAAISHVLIWNWKDIVYAWKHFRLSGLNHEIDDPHYKLMKVYREVPKWWYGVIFIISLAVSMGLPYASGSQLTPAWNILVFTLFGFVLTMTVGFLNAILGFSVSTQGLMRIISAFISPGKPIDNMFASLYGTTTCTQAIALMSDQKLGQYAKVPPRAIFTSQFAGTVLGAILNYVLYISIVNAHFEELKNPLGTRTWSGWSAQSYNSNALTWGALSQELYVSGKKYAIVPIALAIGLFAPLPFYLAYRWTKQKWMAYLNIPVLATYMGWLPYSVNGMWWPGFLIGLWSQWYMRIYRPRWFNKYNYLTSAALDGGTQVIYFILNFAVFGAGGAAVSFPAWWGNTDDPELSYDRCKSR